MVFERRNICIAWLKIRLASPLWILHMKSINKTKQFQNVGACRSINVSCRAFCLVYLEARVGLGKAGRGMGKVSFLLFIRPSMRYWNRCLTAQKTFSKLPPCMFLPNVTRKTIHLFSLLYCFQTRSKNYHSCL